jgi:hypothetical protein
MQEKQRTVMRQTTAIQAAVPDSPESRFMTAADAKKGYLVGQCRLTLSNPR